MIFFYILICSLPFYHQKYLNAAVLGMTGVKLIGLVCFFYALVRLAGGSRTNYLAGRQTKLFLAFIVFALFAAVRIDWYLFGYPPAMMYLSILLLWFVTLTVVDSIDRIRTTAITLVSSMVFASLYIVREQLRFGAMPGFRPGIVLGDPNYFAQIGTAILPVAFFLAQTESIGWRRWLNRGVCVILVIAITLCASRGALVALGVALVYILLRSRRRIRNIALLTVLLVPPIFLLPNNPVDRLLHPGSGDTASTAHRLALLEAGKNMIRAHPLIGVGLGQFKQLAPQYSGDMVVQQIAHNTYLEVAAETGLIGLLLYLVVALLTINAFGRVRRIALRTGDKLLYGLGMGFQTGFISFCVTSVFLSSEYVKVYWLFVFLSVPLERFARQLDRKEVAAPPQPLAIGARA